MPKPEFRLSQPATDEVQATFDLVRQELKLDTTFPPLAESEAVESVKRLPGPNYKERLEIELLTIDPPGSMDLDQALCIERSQNGYRVYYAIADLAFFVDPGTALDAEVTRRGMTVYGPDVRIPLHPAVLSEDGASLLPNKTRPAALWTMDFNNVGKLENVNVTRSLVMSRRRLTYEEAQTEIETGTDSSTLQLLAELGPKLVAAEKARGGVSLNVPEQEVHRAPDGQYSLEFRRTLPVEEWNAEISLNTGMAAASIMRKAGVGLFRTLPPADPRDLKRLRQTAAALGISWRENVTYGQLLDTLDSAVPAHAAFMNQATSLFRGAGYLAFGVPDIDGGLIQLTDIDSAKTKHGAIAAEYAHVTAPIRRLADRYASEICLAFCARQAVPAWVLGALPKLPRIMAKAGQTASAYDRIGVDIVEAALLQGRIGEAFEGVAVDLHERGATQIAEVIFPELAILAKATGTGMELGSRREYRLTEASITARSVMFTPV